MTDKKIFRVLEKSLFSKDKVRIKWNTNFKPLPQTLAGEINDFWARQQHRPHLFNGQLARLDSWTVNDGHLLLHLRRSDYRTLLYSNAHIKKTESEWGADYFPRALGISAVLVTADAQIVLIRRSKDVGEFSNCFDVFGGHIDAPSGSNAPCVYKSMEKELAEEAGLAASDFELLLIGLIEAVPNRKPELVFCAHCKLNLPKILEKASNAKDQFEYSEIFALNQSQLEDFMQKNKSSFSPSAFGCLVITSGFLQKTDKGNCCG
ncbi:MAG: hypothetical protein GWP06_00780 [Actinobacteria bacterium]|nr:hypothetical protein [Actinomycetota bacterium]